MSYKYYNKKIVPLKFDLEEFTDINHEYDLLAYLVKDVDFLNKGLVKEDFFYYDHNKIIFNIIVGYFESNIKKLDPIMILEAVKSHEDYEKKIQPQITDFNDTLEFHFVTLTKEKQAILKCKYLKNYAELRQVAHKISESIDALQSCDKYDVTNAVNTVKQKFLEIETTDNEEEFITIQQYNKKNVEFQQYLFEHPNLERKTFKTYYKKLDHILGDVTDDHLMVIAGATGGGKTTFSTNIVTNNLINGKKVLYFTLEVNHENIIKKIHSRLSKLTTYTLTEIRRGDPEDLNRFISATHESNEFELVTYDKPISAEEAITKAFKAQDLYGKFDVIVFDYLMKLGVAKKTNNSTERASYISSTLANLTKLIKTPVILLAQLNRNFMTRQDKKPILQDLKDSSTIEQDAYSVILLRDKNEENNTQFEYMVKTKGFDNMEIIAEVAKNRNGQVGEVEFDYIKKYNTIKEKNAY